MPKNPYQPRKMLPKRYILALLLGLPCVFLVYRTFTGDITHVSKHCLLEQYDDGIEVLSLKGCKLDKLPAEISRFKRLKRLDLANNKLNSIPALPKSLEIVFFLGNEFEEVPKSLSALNNLMMLSFKSNHIKTIEAGVLPSSLKWLILTGNELSALPADMGRLKKLRKVMLSNNQLESLPPSMAECEDIELLRLANNNFLAIPTFVTTLPKLAFLAVAGNAAIQQPSSWGKGHEVDLESLALKDVLGEGTSGIVYKSSFKGAAVAVKVYKKVLSSDGRNIDEVHLSASLDHPNVVKVRAALSVADCKLNLIIDSRLLSIPSFSPGVLSRRSLRRSLPAFSPHRSSA
jgi:hypothetical protein